MQRFFTVLLVILIPFTAFCCDFDGDGIDDPTSYTSSEIKTLYSSDNSQQIFNITGNALYMVPAKYFGNSEPTSFAYINSSYFWKITSADDSVYQIPNFGNEDATVITGHDFDGDGLDDAAKVLNTCKKRTKSCHKKKPSYNFIFNNVEDDVPFKNITLLTKFFSKGLSPLFVMDANNDGKDDICYGNPLRKNKKKFKAICKDVGSQEIVEKFKIGKIFKLPLSAVVNGKSLVVNWKSSKRRGETKIRLISPESGVDTIKFTIPSVGEVLIGDWLGVGSEQIGVASGTLLTIFNPQDSTTSIKLIPEGEPLDCNNNLYGRATNIYLKTRNVCKVLGCD